MYGVLENIAETPVPNGFSLFLQCSRISILRHKTQLQKTLLEIKSKHQKWRPHMIFLGEWFLIRHSSIITWELTISGCGVGAVTELPACSDARYFFFNFCNL